MAEELIKKRWCHPARAQHGWACDQWRTAPGEWFCGFCGLALPPVIVELEPDIGSSSPPGAKQRRINVACQRTADLRDEDLKDFELTIDVTDPNEDSDTLDLPIEPAEKAGRIELGLGGMAGQGPFDIIMGLRNRKCASVTSPIAVGSYDYVSPELRLWPSAPISLPRTPAPFAVHLTVTPADAHPLSVTLGIPAFGIRIPGAILMDEPGRLTATFDPDESTWRAIEKLRGTSAAILALTFYGVAGDALVDGAKVARPTPPDLRIILGDKMRGLSGRRARVPMLLRNLGGSPATIEEFRWKLVASAGEVVSRGSVSEFANFVVQAQGEYHEELRPPLTDEGGQNLAPGLYELVTEVAFKGQIDGAETQSVAHQSKDIEIRPDRLFQGMVCIDFGTTDTAAAIIGSGDSYFHDPAHGQTPRPLELGLIGVDTQPSKFFLPTRAAVGVDGGGKIVTRYAEAALRSVEQLRQGRLIDRLKWRLGENAQLDGYSERFSIQEIVGGYLKHVRELIEEHPAVAARIERVVATRPAKFGGKVQILMDCFESAGMEVDAERFGDGVPPMVSESWPPVLFMLPIKEVGSPQPSTRLLASLFDRFQAEKAPPLIDREALRKASHFLCTFDIGGGSMDVSLLKLEMVDAQIRVSDLAAFTNDRFAGEGFRDLIVKECSRFAPGILFGESEGTPRRNLDALRNFARSIQNNQNGPFRWIYSSTDEFFADFEKETPESKTSILALLQDTPFEAIWPPLDAPGLVRKLCESRSELARDNSVYYLELETDGAPLILSFSDGTETGNSLLAKLMFRIVLRFAEEFDSAINSLFLSLQKRLESEESNIPVRVLLTGRGSLFILAEALVMVRAMSFLGTERNNMYRGSGESAKAVTSWGGLALKAAREASETFQFTGLGGNGYAIYAPLPIIGTISRAALRPLDGNVWGLPLVELKDGFSTTKWLFVGQDQGDVGDPEQLARIQNFRLANHLREHPDAWIVFDRESTTLEVRMLDEALHPGVSTTKGEG